MIKPGSVRRAGSPQIPHLEKRKTSLEPAVKGAKMFLGSELSS